MSYQVSDQNDMSNKLDNHQNVVYLPGHGSDSAANNLVSGSGSTRYMHSINTDVYGDYHISRPFSQGNKKTTDWAELIRESREANKNFQEVAAQERRKELAVLSRTNAPFIFALEQFSGAMDDTWRGGCRDQKLEHINPVFFFNKCLMLLAVAGVKSKSLSWVKPNKNATKEAGIEYCYSSFFDKNVNNVPEAPLEDDLIGKDVIIGMEGFLKLNSIIGEIDGCIKLISGFSKKIEVENPELKVSFFRNFINNLHDCTEEQIKNGEMINPLEDSFFKEKECAKNLFGLLRDVYPYLALNKVIIKSYPRYDVEKASEFTEWHMENELLPQLSSTANSMGFQFETEDCAYAIFAQIFKYSGDAFLKNPEGTYSIQESIIYIQKMIEFIAYLDCVLSSFLKSVRETSKVLNYHPMPEILSRINQLVSYRNLLIRTISTINS